MQNCRKISFYFLAAFILLIGGLKLGAPFIAILFSYLVLDQLMVMKRVWAAILLYLLVVLGVSYATFYAGREAVEALPDIANRSIPVVIEYAQQQGIELPFTDTDGFKAELVKSIKSQLKVVASSAELLTRQFVVIVLALVIAVSIFLNPVIDLNQGKYAIKDNYYSALCIEVGTRFQTFYKSFRTVMGAQLVISLINTFFTSVFIVAEGLPHRPLIIMATFLCGLLPIVGNIISNTIICGVALTVSVWKAGFALVFLIVLHKFEYFLNSKIIGGRIKNPMWMTLSSLVIGEYLLGIPGMILAPVVLHYAKTELSQVEVTRSAL